MVTARGKIGPAVMLALGLLVCRSPAAQPPPAKEAAPWETEQFKRLKLDLTQRELIQLQAELRKTQLELKFWEEREKTFAAGIPIPASAVEERLNQEPDIATQLARIQQLKDQIAEVSKISTPGKVNEVITGFQNQINGLEKSVKDLRDRHREDIRKQLREKAYDEFKGKLVQIREQIDLGKKHEEAAQAELVRLSKEVPAPTSAGDPRVSQLEQEVRQLKETVAELKKRQ
jgi:hypothetical protein